jgi:hypothetical protein
MKSTQTIIILRVYVCKCVQYLIIIPLSQVGEPTEPKIFWGDLPQNNHFISCELMDNHQTCSTPITLPKLNKSVASNDITNGPSF